jgi:hypothetical protein
MTYEDRERFTLFGIHYQSTVAEANAVWLRIMDSPEWAEYDQVREMLDQGLFPTNEAECRANLSALVERQTALYRKLSRMVAEATSQETEVHWPPTTNAS